MFNLTSTDNLPMDEDLIISQNEMMLNDTFNFSKLGINPRPLAEFLFKHPGKVSFDLVYETNDGKFEMDVKIRDGSDKLVGYLIGRYMKKKVVILLETITEEMLKEKGCLEDPTIGDLRRIAKEIHPNAIPVNAIICDRMWKTAPHYYLLKYLLKEKGVEIPDIDVLSSVKEDDLDASPFIDWNSSCGFWDYFDGDGGSGRIYGSLPVFCYCLVDKLN